MVIRQRASAALHSVANMAEGFPGNAVRAVENMKRAAKALPALAARQIHRFARRICGCHHETAAGCALYRKDGPDRCECACHPAEPPSGARVVYTFAAEGHEEVRAALADVGAAAARFRGTPLHIRVTRAN